MTTSAAYIEPMPTGGSSRAHLASRNPYRAGEDPVFPPPPSASFSGDASRNPYTGSMNSIPRRKPLPPSRENSYGSEPASSRDDIYSATPPPHPLFPPPRPDLTPLQGHGHHYHTERRPALPQRPHTLEELPRASRTMTPPPPPPVLPPRPRQEQFFTFRRRVSQLSSSGDGQVMQLPPRRLLTTDDVPVNSVGYTRNPEKVIAYLIPLPAPIRKGQPMEVPQVSPSLPFRSHNMNFILTISFPNPKRYMIYTPPAPPLLKPQGKEGKRHKAKRLAQEEVKKAKTFSGKTLSLRGLHSKTLRGADWAVSAIRNADITFLNRVPRKEVGELILIHPASVLENESSEDVHREFTRQLARTRRKAAKHSIISSALFAPAVVIDTLAAVIWPFGGLAEIDGVWMYTSLSGYLTARSVSKRLDQTSVTTAGASEQVRLARVLRGESSITAEEEPSSSFQTGLEDVDLSASEDPRRRQVRFQEELDEEDEKLQAKNAAKKNSPKKVVKVRFVPDEAMDTMSRYFQEICHKRNPKAFPSSGVPPTKTEVLASIGWQPERRARAPGQSHSEGVWADENVGFSNVCLRAREYCLTDLKFSPIVAKPPSQGGHRQSHDEGRQKLGPVVQVVRPIPPAGNEGEGAQHGVRGNEEVTSEKG